MRHLHLMCQASKAETEAARATQMVDDDHDRIVQIFTDKLKKDQSLMQLWVGREYQCIKGLCPAVQSILNLSCSCGCARGPACESATNFPIIITEFDMA